MNTIERFRPELHPLNAEWSADTLETIFSSHDPSQPRRIAKGRRLALFGAATAGVFAVGGVAYATGLVPGLVTDELDAVSPSGVSNVHEVASFSTGSDGKTHTFEIWRGTNEDGQTCTAVLEARGNFGPEFGGSCGDYPTDAWFDATSVSYKINETPPPSTYFVYGEPALDGVETVRVSGEGFEHSVAIDPATGGYAVAIPELESVSGHFATVEFIDADGTVVGTSELSDR